MNIVEKLKLLVKLNGPANELIKEGAQLKTGYKTAHFWVTVLGTLVTVAGALNGVIPPQVALIATVGLTLAYNLVRALDNAGQAGVQPLLQSTRFWVGALGLGMTAIESLQAGGVNPAWFGAATTVIGLGMTAAQALGAQQPAAPEQPKA